MILESIALITLERESAHQYQDRDSQECYIWARPIFRIRFRLLDRRDDVSWVEMDCRQKEWSKEVSKEHYLSYVALEVVILPYMYVLIGP